MKSYATFFLIAVMTLGLFTLIVTKSGTKHDAPAEVVEAPAEQADAGEDAAASLASASGSASAAPPPAPAGQPLRVSSLGWDLVAAGAALAGADGKIAPAMELAPESSLDAVEARLARGGADPQGADVAILPLPAFVVAYERLRALEPQAFLVVGFSRGREEVRSAPGALLKAPPAGDEVKLVGFSPQTAADNAARSWGSESATLVGVFALDLLGVAPSRIKLLAPTAEGAKAAPFAALVRGAADERKVAFSTADASRLVPIVAVAARGMLEGRTKELTTFATTWLDGLGRASKDAPGIARRLAAKENLPLASGVGGAPEALHLVERLGQIEDATPASQNAMFVAASPVTLATLAQRTWALARGSGLTSTGAPDPLPIDARVAKAIAPPPAAPPKPEGQPGAVPPNATPLVLYRETGASADAASVAAQLGFLAGVFERAVFRVSAKGGEKEARAIVDAAVEKHGLAPTRAAVATAEPQGVLATIEILSPP